MDQLSRRIIGFAVHAGDCDGVAYCRMFNKIITGKSLPKYLSSDNDPLFLFHRWVANLSILEIDEIKSVPGVPISNPFVERVIGTTRRELLDHTLFFNKRDLQNKLDAFHQYYNVTRGHSSLGGVIRQKAPLIVRQLVKWVICQLGIIGCPTAVGYINFQLLRKLRISHTTGNR